MLSQWSAVRGEWSGPREQSMRGPEANGEQGGSESSRVCRGSVGQGPQPPWGSLCWSPNAPDDNPFEKISHHAWCPVGN